MSRFEQIPSTYSGSAFVSISASQSRISSAGVEQYFSDAKTLTPKYDSENDDLALIAYRDESGLLTLQETNRPYTFSPFAILNSRQIGIDVRELDSFVRIPLRYDEDAEVPYIRLEPLRDRLGGEQ